MIALVNSQSSYLHNLGQVKRKSQREQANRARHNIQKTPSTSSEGPQALNSTPQGDLQIRIILESEAIVEKSV